MIRNDLIALTTDDLADLANRGIVKRAVREIGSQDFSATIEGAETGDLKFVWSDGVVCTLPNGKVLTDGNCTCPATGMCRHLVRSVLRYQHEFSDSVEAKAIEPWDPGTITDETLSSTLTPHLLKRADQLWETGVVVELVRSKKPLALFHGLGHTVRFLISHDLRYTQCDCIEANPCVHVPLAIRAFRELDASLDNSLLDTTEDIGDDQELLDHSSQLLDDFIIAGLGNFAPERLDRLSASASVLRESGSIWLSDILADLEVQHRHYHSHNARFTPREVASHIGEFALRKKALQNPALPIPKLFVRGSKNHQKSELGSSTMIGLGCVVVPRGRGVDITAVLQNKSNGKVHILGKFFPDPGGDDKPVAYSILARRLVMHGRDICAFGRSQLIIKNAKISSSHRLTISRSSAATYAQGFNWESLKAPVLAEDFDEISKRLAMLPPASLRPRRFGENFHVVPIERFEDARFSERDQAIRATIVDNDGQTAELFHRYLFRNQSGTERLLNWLMRGAKPLFVAGNVHVTTLGLRLEPSAVIFEHDGARIAVLPWVDDMDTFSERADVTIGSETAPDNAFDTFKRDLERELGDAFLIGYQETRQTVKRWSHLAERSDELACPVIGDSIRTLIASFDSPEAYLSAIYSVAGTTRLTIEVG